MQEGGRDVGASQKVVVKKIRPLSQCHGLGSWRIDVGFASVGVGCCGHNVDQRGRICGDHKSNIFCCLHGGKDASGTF